MKMIEKGYCRCGCGQKTSLAKQTIKILGIKKEEPHKFIRGHHIRGNTHPNWKGGKTNKGRYNRIWMPDHPKAVNHYIEEHILLAEKALGKSIPNMVQVHHFPNKHEWINLVICENAAYHKLLHRKQEALYSSGNSNWRKCRICKKWDDPQNLSIIKTGISYHKTCNTQSHKDYLQKQAK